MKLLSLLELLRKNRPFTWTHRHETAYEKMKNLFTESTMLKFADPRKPYILTTDSSAYALGAVLSQKNSEWDEEVIAFISWTLKGPEINYFTTGKEMLALVWALNKLEFHLK